MDQTPRPQRVHEQPTPYVKRFEDDYLLSRELQILTDLSQRGAPVPRVLAGDFESHTITMAHAGTPLIDEIAKVADRPAARLAWLCSYGPNILEAIQTICRHGVYHLDLACRNFLVAQQQPVLIDFGLALCSRFPLQKPLWLIPSESLHHPALIAALRADWAAFFRESGEIRDFCAERDLPFPPPLTAGMSLPGRAYSTYWPKRLEANRLDDPMALVSYNTGALLHEIAARLGLTEPRGQGADAHAHAIQTICASLQSLTSKTPPEQRLVNAIAAIATLGSTPRPHASDYQRSAEDPTAPLPTHTRTAPARAIRRPTEGLHWLMRAGSACLMLIGFVLIDAAYRQSGAVLGDEGFAAALAAIAVGFGVAVSLALSRGMLAQRVLSLLLIVLSIPLLVEAFVQGASILQVAFPIMALVLGFAALIALPREVSTKDA